MEAEKLKEECERLRKQRDSLQEQCDILLLYQQRDALQEQCELLQRECDGLQEQCDTYSEEKEEKDKMINSLKMQLEAFIVQEPKNIKDATKGLSKQVESLIIESECKKDAKKEDSSQESSENTVHLESNQYIANLNKLHTMRMEFIIEFEGKDKAWFAEFMNGFPGYLSFSLPRIKARVMYTRYLREKNELQQDHTNVTVQSFAVHMNRILSPSVERFLSLVHGVGKPEEVRMQEYKDYCENNECLAQ